MQIEIMKTSELVPYAKNAKLHSDSQVAAIAGSIREFGFNNPVLIDKDNGIIAGHGRVLAAQVLKMIDVPCIRLAHLTDTQKRAYILADNRLQETGGGWNEEMLKIELGELQTLDFDLSLTGFDGEFIADLNGGAEGLTDPDDVPEPPKEPRTKLGDIWQLGDHRLMCGDSTKKENVSALIAKDKITCVFTDPPYGVSIGKKNTMLNTFQKSGRCLDDLNMDDMKPEELKAMLLAAFAAWRPYFADDCAVFVCSPQGGGLGMMMMMMQESCLEVRHILNWVKNSPTFSMGRLDYDYQHEPILFTWVKTHKRKKEGQFQTSLWQVDKPRACKEHPTMKPVELPECAILNHTDAGDIVADLFGGSGTTLIAAEKTGRRARLIEISPRYCDVIIKRWEDFTGKKAELITK